MQTNKIPKAKTEATFVAPRLTYGAIRGIAGHSIGSIEALELSCNTYEEIR
jgi:hypothetical protein